MENDIYNKLRESIHQYSIGMPSTDSGIEISILKKLFTENEANVYMALTNKLESVHTIATRLDRSEESVVAVLAEMTAKGLTFPKTEDGRRYYAAAPFMHGLFEHQAYVGNHDKELVKLMDDYVTGEFRPKYSGMRTVPLHLDIKADLPVLPIDDVRRIIESKDRIGLIRCACGDHAETLEHKCERPRDVCIVFDYYAEYTIEEMKIGRWITREEALKVLDETDRLGMVHQTGGNHKTTECICNCCPDCCTGLRKIRAMKKPAYAMPTNHYAELDADLCSLCEICLERCPMGAILLEKDSMSVDRLRCIGCGLCTSTCPTEAITLKMKSGNDLKAPQEDYLFMRSSADLQRELEEEKRSKP